MKNCSDTYIRTCILRTTLAGFLLICCGGCATIYTTKFSPPPRDTVKLNPGDTIDIKFYYASQLNDTQVIRPDGLISLQLVGELKVWGMTPGDLQKVLYARYSKVIEKPDVAVIVRKLANRGVYIGGAVKRPGRIEMPGHITVLEAIMQSGGFNSISANVGDVIVLRREGDAYKPYHINYKHVLKGKKKDLFYLHAQDIVYVSRTAVDNMNQWVDQHINNMIPQFGVRYTRTSGNSAFTVDTSDYRR